MCDRMLRIVPLHREQVKTAPEQRISPHSVSTSHRSGARLHQSAELITYSSPRKDVSVVTGKHMVVMAWTPKRSSPTPWYPPS